MAYHKHEGRPVTCIRCGAGGGTLVKIDENTYRHQRPEMCRPKESK